MNDKRLDRLYPALTAKERGLLVLRAYKAGQKPDAEIYRSTPSSQGRAFNRYIRLMNAVNGELATVLQVLQVQVEKLDLRHAWFLTVHRWSIETGVAATEEHPFRDDEYIAGEDGEPLIPWPTWDRVEAEKRAELKRLVADGTIVGRTRGRALSLNAGSFYDWLGRPVPAVTKRGALYDVHRDEDADEVAALRRSRAMVQQVIDHAPQRLALPLDLGTPIESPLPAGGYEDSLGRALALAIRDGLQIHWQELRAIEVGVGEVAEEFGGEDPLKPEVRALLDGCLASCTGLRGQMADFVEIELPEPAEDDVEQVRAFIEKMSEG